MDKGIQNLTVELLARYSQATDTADWRHAFLTLWQLLENFARPTGETGRFTLTNRVNTFLGPDQLREDVLKTFEMSRHQLVHRGKFSETGSLEVGYLLIIIERVLLKFLRNPRMFRTPSDLLEFFQHAPAATSTLKTRKKVIEHILRTRK
jgi:hypothetical protein